MPRPFAPPGTRTNFLADRPVQLQHARLEWDLDLVGRRLGGTADLDPAAPGATASPTISFDAIELNVSGGDGQRPPGDVRHRRRRAPPRRLPRACGRGRDAGGRHPLHLPAPPRASTSSVRTPTIRTARRNAGRRGRTTIRGTTGPASITPIEKFTTEVICTAPAGNFVLSNGVLRERAELPGERVRWHYALDFPQPAYLVTLVAGPSSRSPTGAPRTGVDVFYYVTPGREADARRTFSRTPEMIDFFSERIGVPYPHPRYSQIAVPEFIFGGMENTIGDDADRSRAARRAGRPGPRRRGAGVARAGPPVVGRSAHLPRMVRGLAERRVRHLLRVRLARARQGARRGRHRAARRHRQLPGRGGALPATGRLPAVRRADPSLRLAPLRKRAGACCTCSGTSSGTRRSGARSGTTPRTHARGSVETRDLARAIEEATGRNVDELFDRWLARPGHPELECALELGRRPQAGDAAARAEADDRPDTPPFKFSTRGALRGRGARAGRARDRHARPRTTSSSGCRRGRRRSIFDPGDVVLKTIKLDKSRALWRRQLAAARLAIDRVAGGARPGRAPRSRRGGGAGGGAARRSLLGRARRRGARARADRGARTRATPAGDAGRQRTRGCAAPSAAALGELRRRRGGGAGAGRPAAARRSELLRRGRGGAGARANALAAGAGGAAGLDRPALVPGRDPYAAPSRGWGAPATSAPCRSCAMRGGRRRPGSPARAVVAALAELAYGTGMRARRARARSSTRLRDRDFRVRGEAAAALARLGAPEALPAIRGALAGELDGRTRRRMNDAIRDLETGTRPPSEVRQLHDEVVAAARREREAARAARSAWRRALGDGPRLRQRPVARGRSARARSSRRPRSTRPVAALNVSR